MSKSFHKSVRDSILIKDVSFRSFWNMVIWVWGAKRRHQPMVDFIIIFIMLPFLKLKYICCARHYARVFVWFVLQTYWIEIITPTFKGTKERKKKRKEALESEITCPRRLHTAGTRCTRRSIWNVYPLPFAVANSILIEISSKLIKIEWVISSYPETEKRLRRMKAEKKALDSKYQVLASTLQTSRE